MTRTMEKRQRREQLKAIGAGLWFVTGLLGVCLVAESESVLAMLAAIGWLGGAAWATRHVDVEKAFPRLMEDE